MNEKPNQVIQLAPIIRDKAGERRICPRIAITIDDPETYRAEMVVDAMRLLGEALSDRGAQDLAERYGFAIEYDPGTWEPIE